MRTALTSKARMTPAATVWPMLPRRCGWPPLIMSNRPMILSRDASSEGFAGLQPKLDGRRACSGGFKRRSGADAAGPGDKACGAWLESELKRLGYAVQRQRFQAPYFDIAKAELAVGPARAQLIPQAVVVQTPAGGISAPLRLAEPGVNLAGAIAL